MIDNKQTMKKKLHNLTLKFREKLPWRLQELEKYTQMLLAKNWDKKIALKIQSELHRLTGTGKSFGFTILSARARRMELFLSHLIKKDRELKEGQKHKLCTFFSGLQESFRDFGGEAS